MAATNEERVFAAYWALERGDMDAAQRLLAPDVELRDRAESPDPKVYRGREGFAASVSESLESFEELHFLPEQAFEHGDHVVVVLTMSGRGRASGVPVEERIAHLWAVRDGIATRLQAYTDPADALEAAGLPRDLYGGPEGEAATRPQAH
jgi:ketosteroid isomerase-like protein